MTQGHSPLSVPTVISTLLWPGAGWHLGFLGPDQHQEGKAGKAGRRIPSEPLAAHAPMASPDMVPTVTWHGQIYTWQGPR